MSQPKLTTRIDVEGTDARLPIQPGRSKQGLARRYVAQLQAIARELYDSELFRESSDLYRYLTLVESTNPSNWYWLGRSFFALGDPLNAAQVFELGGRISHIEQFQLLAAEAWEKAGYPDRASAVASRNGAAA